MKEALLKYKSGKFGLNEIYSMNNVPKPTLKRHSNSTNIEAKEGAKALVGVQFSMLVLKCN